VVVSPHLDDGVLSLGAAISHARRRGAQVAILTVLAGEPSSSAPAGPWDRKSGFGTAGEAARVRREEDRRACGILGAEPRWLPHEDHQYERRADDKAIRADVIEAVGDAMVLLPGFPLSHDDHAWVAVLLEGAFARERVGYYVEQPYAIWTGDQPFDWVAPGSAHPAQWRPAAADARDRLRKLRACRAYASQLPHLGSRPLLATCRREARLGGELITWAQESDYAATAEQ
jgi:LmbE family N-acetylglucosaminyl deacetylase